MYLMIGILMLLVIGSFIMLVTGAAEVEKLRAQNRYLVEQIARIRHEQSDLLKLLQSGASLGNATTAGVPVAAVAVAAGGGAAGLPSSSTGMTLSGTLDESTIKKIRNNARSLQTVVEGFALDHGGAYPASIRELEAYAVANAANIAVTNPFTGIAGFITDGDLTLDISDNAVDEGVTENAGKLLYQANAAGDLVTGYMIAALDGQGFLFKETDGVPFTLGV
jgi:type II secretory pathway pseudopilin PulG